MLCASLDSALRARITSVRPLAARAGSALVFHAGRLVVIQDDALSVVVVDPRAATSEQIALEGDGGPTQKSKKPDFEAAFLGLGSSLTILGSGSSPARRRAAQLDLDKRRAAISDLGPLYDAVAAAISGLPNIEGALLQGGVLRLFHRGAGGSPSVIVDVDAEVLAMGPARVLGVCAVDLGLASGVPLHFTDATLVRGRAVYLAVAEDTPNAIDDGPIVGAALGVLEGGAARHAMLHEASGEPSVRKLEGIAEDPATGVLYAVSDPDDPDKPAELCVIELEGFFSSSPHRRPSP
jgi:hypothetical protein